MPELRYFSQVDEKVYKLELFFTEMKNGPTFSQSSVERRTDEYIMLDNNEFGLKLRGGKKLELKIRTGLDKDGVAIWRKVVKINLKQVTLHDGAEFQQLIVNELMKASNSNFVSSVIKDSIIRCATLVECSAQPLTIVRCIKARRVWRGWESTVGTLCVISSSAKKHKSASRSTPIKMGSFQTVSYEGGDGGLWASRVQSALASRNIDMLQCDYPQFIGQYLDVLDTR